MPLTNPDQERAIDAQAAVYGTDPTICRGLDHYKVHPASDWDTEGTPPWPAGAVAVDFHYIEPPTDRWMAYDPDRDMWLTEPDPDDHERRIGLEVTIFDADGTPLDSQDFGTWS